MTIATIQPLSAGNALRLFLAPPPGAVAWRILRKGDDSFSGPEDDEAIVVFEGEERVIVDSEWLQNEVAVCYRPYYRVDGDWHEGPAAWGTPLATYEDLSTDALVIVRDRLEAGLAVEVERGEFTSRIGHIQVFTAPPSLEGSVHFPVVTLHLDSEVPAVRGIGEEIVGDEFDDLADEGEWLESEGWLAQVQLSVIGWSQNADERIDLRRALRRIIVANLPVFDAAGMINIEFRAQDVDALNGEYNANIYQVMGSFSCLAPVRVGSRTNAIRTVESRVTNG